MNFIENARNRLFGKLDGQELPIERIEDQSADDKAVVSFVKNRLEESRQSSARVAKEGIALTNIAYLCGFDSIYFDGVSRTFKPTPTPSQFLKRSRVHVNRILPTIQNRLARLTKNEPRWDVRPNSGDDEDKDAARLAEETILHLWDALRINKKRIPLTMWLQQCGVAYLKVCWDPSLGKKQVMPREDQENHGATVYDIVAEGDIRVDIKSYFNIFPDPLAKDFDDLRYLHEANIRPIDYFALQYPERGHLVKEEDCWINSLSYEARINSINTQTGTSGTSASQLKNSAIEISYYEKPSGKHPYGRHVITANGVLLKDDILPIDEIPFIKFDDIVIGGKFDSEAIITHLRPLQDQLNRLKTMRAAWSNRMLTGKMLGARHHNIAQEAFNDQSGEWLKYDPIPGVPEPHALQMPVIPQYAYEEETTLKEDMNDTAGVNEASRGQTPNAQMPAIGMQLLVEQDDTRIGTETEGHENSYADLGRILLKFVDKYYETERLVKCVGQNMEYTIKKVKGADIRKSFDVRVIRGSTLPGSKVLKRQEIINLHQGGYFGDPKDPLILQNVLSMLEYGEEFQAWKRHSLRMSQIQKGVTTIERGEKPGVSEFDDHALWLQELDNYRLSDKYDKLDETQKTIVLTLMNEHTDWIAQLSGLSQPEPSMDPHLVPTDAAQKAEEQAKAMVHESGMAGEMHTQPPMVAPQMNQPELTPPAGPEMPQGVA